MAITKRSSSSDCPTVARNFCQVAALVVAVFGASISSVVSAASVHQEPLFLTQSQPPLVMLDVARDHRLYYEAYNDYSDLDGDGSLDIGYKPTKINYYGYFDSFKCYQYSATDRRFDPVSISATKQCGGVYWSGDFLNYLTTSRADALRRVFYGGYRSTDTGSLTVLERVFIPQDSHTWGKEYTSIQYDGYEISDYAPLSSPAPGRRHLFANVTLAQSDQTTGDTSDSVGGGHGVMTLNEATGENAATNPPLLRVLQNSPVRIWNWISKERPVAGRYCLVGTNQNGSCFGSATAGGWEVVPGGSLTNLNATYYAVAPGATISGTGDWSGIAFSGAVTGTSQLRRIDCDASETYEVFDDAAGVNRVFNVDCNPATPTTQGGTDEDYAMQVAGNITVPTSGTYYFAVDGDDATELLINGSVVIGRYGSNAFSTCNNPTSTDYGLFDTTCSANRGSIVLAAGTHTLEFRHHEQTGNDGYRLWWKVGTATAQRSNYEVRVKVCDESVGLESNCKVYTDGVSTSYKPTGLLHTYGGNDGMYFGLLTGSYRNNTQGGVIRKNISSFKDEFSATTGAYTTVNGIVGTLNRLRTTGFVYGSSRSYTAGAPSGSCGWITGAPMTNGQCEMWGNPLGEMIFESLRYLSGRTAPVPVFDYSGTRTDSDTLGLPKPGWIDPYATSAVRSPASIPYCSKPYIMAVSDSYPSFDSDTVPGSYFGGTTETLANVDTQPNVQTQGQTIWDNESGLGGTKSIFIGQSEAISDSGPTAKDASSFGNIRGLAPSDPTRQGSYSSSALAYYARINDLRTDKAGSQKLGFYSIALAPPLPTIEVPVSGGKVTIVPFAKSVGQDGTDWTGRAFLPTNQIVDFYIDVIRNTDASNVDAAINGGRPYYRFRINYEDVEQGADHDMDAIAVYEVWLNADNSISVNIVSEYAAGGIKQHMGYVISGTSADGTYLVVRDSDTAATADFDYALDTPNTAGVPLPLSYPTAVTIGTPCTNRADNYACRTFTPDTSSTSAIYLKDPLWYAAKWGGFNDDPTSPDGLPQSLEWDADGNGVPDNYFLVVNPLKLEQQMAAALAKIAKDSGTAAALAANSTSLRTDLKLYQARFSSDGWGGELNAYSVLGNGDLAATPAWQAQRVMAASLDADTRVVLTYDPDVATPPRGIPFRWSSMTTNGAAQTSLNMRWSDSGGAADGLGSDRVTYLRGSDAIPWARTRPCITGTTGATCITNYLGDIVNSAIQFVGAPAFGYVYPSYTQFFNERKTNRASMVYVGANDGMLHGFDANTGEEKLAYVPSSLYRDARLSKLTAADYGQDTNKHVYFVDGTPTIADICRMSGETNDKVCEENTAGGAAANWRTILVGGLGAGGQGVYALDITRPEDFSESLASSLVLWEYTDSDDSDMGLSLSRPAVVRLCTSRDSSSSDTLKPCLAWKWSVVFGNGYDSDALDGIVATNNYAHVFVLDALTGERLVKYTTTAAATPNGMSTLAPVDQDADGVADYAYGADRSGNMWKFDLTEIPSAPSATVSAPAYKLYEAKTLTTAIKQPITTAPEAMLHPLGGVMVLFGTGTYVSVTDKNDKQTQTLYGIWDKAGGSGVTTHADRNNLQQQELITDTRTEDGVVFSTSTANPVNWATKLGWYLDLAADGVIPSERVGYDPQLVGNLLNFVTILPSDDVCAYGGDSWDFLLNPLTGARPDFAAFRGVPQISVSGGDAYASRRKSTVGISPAGTTITVNKGEGIVYKGGSTGDVEKFGVNLVFGLGRRLSWREMETD